MRNVTIENEVGGTPYDACFILFADEARANGMHDMGAIIEMLSVQ